MYRLYFTFNLVLHIQSTHKIVFFMNKLPFFTFKYIYIYHMIYYISI